MTNKIEEIAMRVWYANNTCMPADGMNKLKEFAHALLAELSKDAEPVASICSGWEILFIGSNPIADVVRNHDLKIGDKLFTHPAPVIASEQKPVAYLFEDGSAVIVADMVYVAEKSGQKVEPLFTSPPNTADIEQRTAEAIAKMIQGWSCTNGPSIAEAIRSGKWREYL